MHLNINLSLAADFCYGCRLNQKLLSHVNYLFPEKDVFLDKAEVGVNITQYIYTSIINNCVL